MSTLVFGIHIDHQLLVKIDYGKVEHNDIMRTLFVLS
jgi:hypothetical protein